MPAAAKQPQAQQSWFGSASRMFATAKTAVKDTVNRVISPAKARPAEPAMEQPAPMSPAVGSEDDGMALDADMELALSQLNTPPSGWKSNRSVLLPSPFPHPTLTLPSPCPLPQGTARPTEEQSGAQCEDTGSPECEGEADDMLVALTWEDDGYYTDEDSSNEDISDEDSSDDGAASSSLLSSLQVSCR